MHWRRCLDARNLILFNSINQLLDGLLQEFDFVHFGLLVLFDSRFDGEEPRLVQLLRLDQHVHPELLLSFQILNDRLVVDQVLLVFGEVLGADVLYLLDFGVVLDVNVVVALIHFAGFVRDSLQSRSVLRHNFLVELVLNTLNVFGDLANLLGEPGLRSCVQVLRAGIHHRNAVIQFSLFNVQFILRFLFIGFGCLLQFRNLNLNTLLKVENAIVFEAMSLQELAAVEDSFVVLSELLLEVIDLIVELLEKVAVLEIQVLSGDLDLAV